MKLFNLYPFLFLFYIINFKNNFSLSQKLKKNRKRND